MEAEIVTTFMDRRKASLQGVRKDLVPVVVPPPTPPQKGLHEIEGSFLFRAYIAALQTNTGYMTLEFPFYELLEDLPFSEPEVHKYNSKESFLNTHQCMPGSPSICLTDHFQKANFPEAYPNAPATLYNRKIDRLYRVADEKSYEFNGISMTLSKDHMVAVFAGQVMVIAPENAQRVIKRAASGAAGKMSF
jgi:hypothetical protein